MAPVVLVDLQGQWRLDDQPALERAVARLRSIPGACLVIAADLRQTPPLRGPHQRRLMRQACEGLKRRLAPAGLYLLAGRLGDHGDRLERVVHIERCEPSRLFSSWPIPAGRFPRVFSDFRRQIEGATPSTPEPPLNQDALRGMGYGAEQATQAPEPIGNPHPRSSFPFAGDELSALAHLHQYIHGSNGLRDYKQTRNGLSGVQFSSKFSAWLAIGSLSVRRIWAEILRYQAEHGEDGGSEWMKQELLWREFFIWLEQAHPESFHDIGGIQQRSYIYRDDRELFARWCRADSGHPLIDAALQELNATGYLSNRVRQWVASDFIQRLRLPWLWGARWFAWQLIDAVPSQNIGNWSYLAGVGADPRSFGNAGPRYFDLDKQQRQYDSEGRYAELWH